jgi:hypothetical protein
MLAAMSSIFGPLGILLPIMTKVKILFQETWRINMGQGKRYRLGWKIILYYQSKLKNMGKNYIQTYQLEHESCF